MSEGFRGFAKPAKDKEFKAFVEELKIGWAMQPKGLLNIDFIDELSKKYKSPLSSKGCEKELSDEQN